MNESLSNLINPEDTIILAHLNKAHCRVYEEKDWTNTILKEFLKIKLNVMSRNDPAKIDLKMMKYVSGKLWMQKSKPGSE